MYIVQLIYRNVRQSIHCMKVARAYFDIVMTVVKRNHFYYCKSVHFERERGLVPIFVLTARCPSIPAIVKTYLFWSARSLVAKRLSFRIQQIEV